MIYIKNLLKISSYIFTLFLFGLWVTDTAHASADSGKLHKSNDVKISITNNQTGETTVLNQEDTKNSVKVNSITSDNKSVKVAYDVLVPIKKSKSSGFTRMDVDGSSKTAGGVTAKLNVDYDVNSTEEKVRLNKVFGSWTPSSKMYYLTDRKVTAHSGVPYGKKLSKIPPSNTFSYTTGWGYNVRVGGDSAPRAWSSAIIHISGMTATYTIKLEFTYSI